MMNENHKNMHRLYNYTVINNNFSFFGFLLINLPVPSCPQTFHHRKGKSTSKYSRLLEKKEMYEQAEHILDFHIRIVPEVFSTFLSLTIKASSFSSGLSGNASLKIDLNVSASI